MVFVGTMYEIFSICHVMVVMYETLRKVLFGFDCPGNAHPDIWIFIQVFEF